MEIGFGGYERAVPFEETREFRGNVPKEEARSAERREAIPQTLLSENRFS